MNTTQIRYFLAAARTLNFTEAAKQLYISQPALSKQITAIEHELNMMLFVRNQKKVRLTPAGAVLLKELPKVESQYEKAIQKAKVANEGVSGELSIGLLEGQMVGDTFTKVYKLFAKQYPNIAVRLSRNSFSGLRRQLEDGSIDLAITLEFDILGEPNLQYEKLEVCPAIAAVAKSHPAANKKVTSWADLKEYTIIAVEEEDCYASDKMIIEDCKRAGFSPTIMYAPTLETAMLWAEAGLGICVVNSMNNLTQNPNIKMLDDMICKNTISVMAWQQENINPVIALFTNFYNANGAAVV